MADPAILHRLPDRGTMVLVEHDDEATQLMLEALFDVKAAVFEIREYLTGDEDGSVEEEEENS